MGSGRQTGAHPQGAATAVASSATRPGPRSSPRSSLTAIGSAEEGFYHAALDAVPGHILLLDANRPDYPIAFANSAAARDYGYPPQALVGRAFLSLVDVEDLHELKAKGLGRIMAEGGTLRTELRIQRRDGSKFTAGVTFAPLTGEHGQVSHIVCSGRDITVTLEEQRQRRELQERLYTEMRERERMAIELRMAQKLEAVGRLASGIAHEINTPVQFIGDGVSFLQSAFADLSEILRAHAAAVEALCRGELPAPVRAQLAAAGERLNQPFIEAEIPGAFERTHEGIARVASIVRGMKEFAHPDVQQHSPADLNHAIETTLLVARNEYKYCATVQADLQPLPPVNCNANELNQVFLNLIVNAAHAIQSAGHDASTGRIRVATAATADGVEIAFEDNGCGIAAENIDRIFDPFFTTKEVGKGTGQGLAIARAIIVERHFGTIAVDSTVGCGTRMTVRLPFGAEADATS